MLFLLVFYWLTRLLCFGLWLFAFRFVGFDWFDLVLLGFVLLFLVIFMVLVNSRLLCYYDHLKSVTIII